MAQRFDLPGIALLAGIVGLFMILCGSGDEETISSFPMSLTLLGVELSMILLFVLNETMWAKDPLIPFHLIKANGTGLICLAQCFIQFSLFGVWKIQPVLLSVVAEANDPVQSCSRTSLNSLWESKTSPMPEPVPTCWQVPWDGQWAQWSAEVSSEGEFSRCSTWMFWGTWRLTYIPFNAEPENIKLLESRPPVSLCWAIFWPCYDGQMAQAHGKWSTFFLLP